VCVCACARASVCVRGVRARVRGVRACVCVWCVCVCVFVSFVIQHAMRMRSLTISTVACLALPYFSTLSQKDTIPVQGVTEHKICVLIFSTTFV